MLRRKHFSYDNTCDISHEKCMQIISQFGNSYSYTKTKVVQRQLFHLLRYGLDAILSEKRHIYTSEKRV